MVISIKKVFVLFFAALLSACNSGGSGGEKTSKERKPQTQEAKIWHINGGHDSEKLQQAFDQVKAGDTIIISASPQSYASNLRDNNNINGFVINATGTKEKPIKIIGEAANGINQPVIDQGKTAIHNPSVEKPTAGILIACSSHIIIENIEIRNAHIAGITNSTKGCEKEIENIQLRDLNIHHIYGDHYTAGIRLVNAKNTVISNNHISHIKQENIHGAQVPTIISSNKNRENITISNNTIDNSEMGLINFVSKYTVKNLNINNNTITNITDKAIFLQAIDSGFYNTLNITGNTVENSQYGIFLNLKESNQLSKVATLSQQTFKNINDTAVYLEPINQLSATSNSFTNIGSLFLKTIAHNGSKVEFLTWDNNSYSTSPNAGWSVENSYYDTLSAWQQHTFDNGNKAN